MRDAWRGPDVRFVCDLTAETRCRTPTQSSSRRELGADEVVVVTSRWHAPRSGSCVRLSETRRCRSARRPHEDDFSCVSSRGKSRAWRRCRISCFACARCAAKRARCAPRRATESGRRGVAGRSLTLTADDRPAPVRRYRTFACAPPRGADPDRRSLSLRRGGREAVRADEPTRGASRQASTARRGGARLFRARLQGELAEGGLSIAGRVARSRHAPCRIGIAEAIVLAISARAR